MSTRREALIAKEDWARELLAFRMAKDEAFRTDAQSPVEDRAGFQGLRYFEPNFEARVRPIVSLPESAEPFEMETSTGEMRRDVPVARLQFSLEGNAAELIAFDQGSDWFIPFRDGTSGKETYGAGRYLEVSPVEPIVLDFNYAYNPYCAYSDAWSCPLPPRPNWLAVPIRAGERTFR